MRVNVAVQKAAVLQWWFDVCITSVCVSKCGALAASRYASGDMLHVSRTACLGDLNPDPGSKVWNMLHDSRTVCLGDLNQTQGPRFGMCCMTAARSAWVISTRPRVQGLKHVGFCWVHGSPAG